LGLKGPKDYTEFSKAIFGNEFELTEEPDLVFTYEVGGFGILPVAILFWRYLQSYHSGLPSAHDVITGLWTPSEKEELAGLKSPHDFCTFVNQVGATYMMKNEGPGFDEDLWEYNPRGWNSITPREIESV